MRRWKSVLAILLVGGAPLLADEPSASAEALQKSLTDRDPARRHEAAQAALVVPEPGLAAPLIKLLRDEEPRIVEAAVAALVARTDGKERRDAAKAMAALLKPLPREPDVIDEAREDLFVPALHDLAQVVSIKALLEIHMEAPADRIRARLMAVGNVPSDEAIEALISYGARRRGGDGHRRAMHEALKYATGVDEGRDPDRWRAWWRDAKPTFDHEEAARRRAEQRGKADAREERRRERRGKRGEE